MKKKTKIALFSCLIILIVYAYTEITSYYPEKFIINKIEYQLFSVVDIDSIDSCYSLVDSIINGKEIVIAIRFSPKYINVAHEFLWDYKRNNVFGVFGHLDTIKSINFFNGSNNNIDNEITQANLKGFKIFKHKIYYNTINQSNDCYNAKAFKNVNDFIDNYNNNFDSPLIYDMNNLYFFKIKYNSYLDLCNFKIKMKTKFNTSIRDIPVHLSISNLVPTN